MRGRSWNATVLAWQILGASRLGAVSISDLKRCGMAKARCIALLAGNAGQAGHSPFKKLCERNSVIYHRSPRGQFHIKYLKIVLDGSKVHIQKMVKLVLDGPKTHTQKIVKNDRGLSGRVRHRHTQKMCLNSVSSDPSNTIFWVFSRYWQLARSRGQRKHKNSVKSKESECGKCYDGYVGCVPSLCPHTRTSHEHMWVAVGLTLGL